jgi:nucleotidyltransferase substrate binding protein (TIGR01987 family)
MPGKRAQLDIASFARAMKKLDEALTLNETEIVRDALIQRFEFTFEIAWKSCQRVLRDLGIAAKSPRDALSEAQQQGWLTDLGAWLELMEARNLTSHTYREDVAIRVAATVRNPGAALLRDLLSKLQVLP